MGNLKKEGKKHILQREYGRVALQVATLFIGFTAQLEINPKTKKDAW